MQFASPLVPATLLRRYKRFLADVRLDDGQELTVHCANPGAMTGLAEPGLRIWLEESANPKRKLRYSWKLVELPDGHFAGVDTSVPNRVIGEALRAGAIPQFEGHSNIRPEVRYGEGSRVDFLLTGGPKRDAFVEVKNVHLRRREDIAEFPDCVTARGTRHLRELARIALGRGRAVMIYFVQRTDCARVRLASDIDPVYAATFAEARQGGVEALAYRAEIGLDGIRLGPPVPIVA